MLKTTITAIVLTILTAVSLSAAHADLVWMDGSVTEGNAPPGKLLSDNPNYWGECVFTGVRRSDDASGGRCTAALDFKRDCTFSEVDFLTDSPIAGVEVETAGSDCRWETVVMKESGSTNGRFHRLVLPGQPKGERLRLTIAFNGTNSLKDVWVWGDAEVSAQNPELISPVVVIPSGHYRPYSIPGIERTAMRSGLFRDWVAGLGELAKLPAVWSQVPTWDVISTGPILPAVKDVDPTISITMARNETECAALALTSTSASDTVTADVAVGAFRRAGGDGKQVDSITGKLSAVGAIPSAVYGVCLSPLFEQGNIPGASLMKRYLTNGDMIKDFPKLSLPPTTSAIVWLSVKTDGIEPGVYEASLGCKGGATVRVRVEVLDVTLPRSPAWVETYSSVTEMQPFQYGDRVEREVRYKYSLGTTVWDSFPSPGSREEIARRMGKCDFRVYGLPGKYMRRTEPLTDEDKRIITENVRKIVARAKELGLSYDDWYMEFYDEPAYDDLPSFGKSAELVKQIDPNIRIYCNPTTGNIGDWYNKYVDISCPYVNAGIYEKEPMRLFSAPRKVNAFYKLLANCSKNESRFHMDRYRGLAWEALTRGWNGWGFYAYYAPGGNPWNDFDAGAAPGDEPDWAVVYPGPRGPIASRASEALREGYEDYCLMALLRSKDPKAADAICKRFSGVDWPSGRRGEAEPLASLRLDALRAAAKVNKK